MAIQTAIKASVTALVLIISLRDAKHSYLRAARDRVPFTSNFQGQTRCSGNTVFTALLIIPQYICRCGGTAIDFVHYPYYVRFVIKSFCDKDTETLFELERVRRFGNIERVALRKLRQIASAAELGDLRAPPGNRLEALKGDREGQHSIRINNQWRVCFVWSDGDAYEVEICDYH